MHHQVTAEVHPTAEVHQLPPHRLQAEAAHMTTTETAHPATAEVLHQEAATAEAAHQAMAEVLHQGAATAEVLLHQEAAIAGVHPQEAVTEDNYSQTKPI